MPRREHGARRAAVAAAILLLTAGGSAAETWLVPDEARLREAIAVGERSLVAEAFDAEWRVANGAGESVRVLTPFHRVVLAARQAAFRGSAFGPADARRLVGEQDRRLVLWVALHGPREDFARHYAPRLVVGDRDIKAVFVQNERTAAPRPEGGFVAQCLYGFPTRDLPDGARVALVVADADGREVSRFVIDLGAMR